MDIPPGVVILINDRVLNNNPLMLKTFIEPVRLYESLGFLDISDRGGPGKNKVAFAGVGKGSIMISGIGEGLGGLSLDGIGANNSLMFNVD